jgi:hypothetical protein
MYYKELNLPAIPEELLKFDFTPDGYVLDLGYGLSISKAGILLNSCRYDFGCIGHHPIGDWIREQLPFVKQEDIILQRSHHPTGGVHIVHSDIKRPFALNYILKTGGDNAYTSWYKEHGKRLIRTKNQGKMQSDTGPVLYENLEMLDTVKFEQGKWVLISTGILHDVDEIVGLRQSISISLSYSDKKKLFNQFGINK